MPYHDYVNVAIPLFLLAIFGVRDIIKECQGSSKENIAKCYAFGIIKILFFWLIAVIGYVFFKLALPKLFVESQEWSFFTYAIGLVTTVYILIKVNAYLDVAFGKLLGKTK